MTTEEQVIWIVCRLLSQGVGSEEEQGVLEDCAREVLERVGNYLQGPVPPALLYTAASLCAALYQGGYCEERDIQSMSMGDASITYGGRTQRGAVLDTLMGGVTGQLNTYRRGLFL